jgi:hypothetical protein
MGIVDILKLHMLGKADFQFNLLAIFHMEETWARKVL